MTHLQELQTTAQQSLRAQFPSLSGDQIFLENAGGSQVPSSVPDRMREFMLSGYVQVGAGYPASALATQTFQQAHALANAIMNGDGIGSTVIQPSASQAIKHLAESFSSVLEPGDEVVVAENGHEANIGAWLKLDRFGIKPVWWKVDLEAMDCTRESLLSVLTDRTRVVVFPHVSNLLGTAADVAGITRTVHDAGAKVVVDGVASTPHMAPDVAAWGCDWYVFSNYKVFGPHIASIFGRQEAWDGLTGPNHVFIPKGTMPQKQTLGCPSYEAMAGYLGTGDYIRFASGVAGFGERNDARRERDEGADSERREPSFERSVAPSRKEVVAAFDLFHACERAPLERLLTFLESKASVTVIGQAEMSPDRVGIVSFVSSRATPGEVARATDAAGIGIKTGHMYSFRLCEALGIDTGHGVIRVSLAHYNTVEEIQRLIEVLAPLV